MRYPAEHKRETRKRILHAAARRLRSKGSQGAAIGDLMRDLHLTHGGFYRHFTSKDDLFVEAFQEGHDDFLRTVASAVQAAPKGKQIKALIDTYLDIEHCDNTADGCPVAALATDLARLPQRSKARLAFEKVLKARTAEIAKYMPGATEEERVGKTRMLMAGMSGTLTIARVLTDRQQKIRFLDAAKDFYLKAVGG
jgi:TetR/AcrR family transcriptional regulator, transcriptional repressor for nem operon